MPRIRAKRKPLKTFSPFNGHKYSSFWFALKAIQNNKLLIKSSRNNSFNSNQLIGFNQNCLLMNGFVDENTVSDQMSNRRVNNVESTDPQSAEPSMDELAIKGIKVIELDDKKALIWISSEDSSFELSFGSIRLTLLSNDFDFNINGFTLLADKSIELMAVFGHKVGIKCRTNGTNNENKLNELTQKLQTLGIESIESVLSEFKDNLCLILVEKLCLPSLLYLENIANYKPLSLKSTTNWFEFKNVENVCFERFKVWDKLFDDLKFDKNDVIIVSGGGNVGKSSLIRYFVNRYISKEGSEGLCAYLDCDPGQTEFTTAAQISLTQIMKPMISSTAMNVLNYKPLQSCSVGATTPTKEPKLYISSVSQLVNSFRNDFQSKGPLFVNTMGWTRDLGLALLTDIIKITVPTHVIQIDSTVDHKINFGFDLSPASVCKHYGFRFGSIRNRSLDYKLSIIGSNNKSSKISKTTRVYQQLSYMSQMSDIVFKPLIAMNPFKICWSDVYISVISESRLSPQLFLDVLNCCWIQLCRIDDQKVRFFESNGIRIVDSIDGNRCLGSAIIRGIDFENKCFYVLSPESEETVRSVNCIVRPNGVYIPEYIMFEQMNYAFTSNLPYIYSKT